jgi:hypothetical protein
MTTKEQILASNLNKTQKILKLHALDIKVQEIADLIGSGYGFVWVVINKRNANPQPLCFIPSAFNRKFGIEIEAFNCDKNELIRKLNAAGVQAATGFRTSSHNGWKVTSDGSINGTNSFEIVSPVLEGEQGMAEVEIVCRTLKQMNAKINKTCGLHVHIEGRGFSLAQWRNIYKNYAKLENVIDAFMPISRRANNNTYCKSIKGSRSMVELFEKIDNSRTVKELANMNGTDNRYLKLNAQSYFKHGTIEFRQHSGTIEFTKISNWVRFLHNLVSFSEKNVITNATIEGLREFNQNEIVAYIDERTQELA